MATQKVPALVSFLQSKFFNAGAIGAGHYATGGLGGAAAGSMVADTFGAFVAARQAARVKTVTDLVNAAIRDPQIARNLLQYASKPNDPAAPSALSRASAGLARLSGMYVSRYAAGDRERQQLAGGPPPNRPIATPSGCLRCRAPRLVG
jgi:hypothetical protein